MGPQVASQVVRPLLELRGITKSFGRIDVIDNVSLNVDRGEIITLLGPSGSGKSTILRIIGGFTPPSKGRLLLDGEDITNSPINRRPFNTVFQDYALFPHLTVRNNVGYGLRVRGTARNVADEQIGECLKLVRLEGLQDRYPSQLSGGQRQRVALARAIICNPRLILLDEPLGALDVELRKQMQSLLLDIHREIRTTFILVTHDQEEAIGMADRVCVINHGCILQTGTPKDLYYQPTSQFVARFFGENNLWRGKLGPTGKDFRYIETALCPVHCPVDNQGAAANCSDGEWALVVVRPEEVAVQPVGAKLGPRRDGFEGTVVSISFSGAYTTVRIAGADDREFIQARILSRSAGLSFDAGDSVVASWERSACRLVPL